MFSSYIFRITNLCDKRCPTCCCDTGVNALDPEKFRKKIFEISNFYQNNADKKCFIFLTGGEPFFYRFKSPSGILWTIVDLVRLIKTQLPAASIIIKTSGWREHPFLDKLVSMIATLKGGPVEIRLGFNLFQKLGAEAENRLNHMLSLLLTFQQSVVVETIYNKENKDQTLRIIGKALSQFSEKFENFGDALSSPDEGYVVNFPFSLLIQDNLGKKLTIEKQISLWTMPAHSGKSKKQGDQYFECKNSGICTNIKFGPNQIMYNSDLSFYHCNDAFADFSHPAFTPKSYWTIEDEFLFLNKKFNKLRSQLI